ncbi:hypothetical protein [Fischerella sp. NIES-3754]|uniref:hypothetical protein n=1 Tax=Fischerella sp. NIES-3754 TaxID=1752063 RepID=UPI000B2A011E|nr:hypothetical protein [Fischerella sp. NIES-3754]
MFYLNENGCKKSNTDAHGWTQIDFLLVADCELPLAVGFGDRSKFTILHELITDFSGIF